MKQRIALVRTVLATFCLVMISSSLSQGQVKSRDGKLEISPYGALKKVRGADGKERKLRVGYFVGYRFTNPRTSKEEEKSLYAVGDDRSGELEEARTNQAPSVNNAARTSVRTKDGALRLDHEVTLDNGAGKLENKIVIRNTSSKPVQLALVKIGADSGLAGGREILKQPHIKELGPLVSRITGAGFYQGDCAPQDICPVPPCCFLPPPFCKSGLAIGIVKDTDSSWREFKSFRTGESDPLSSLIKSGDYAVTLYWRGGVNLNNVRLSPNGVATIIVQYRLR